MSTLGPHRELIVGEVLRSHARDGLINPSACARGENNRPPAFEGPMGETFMASVC